MDQQLIQAFNFCTSNINSQRLQGEQLLQSMQQQIQYPVHLLIFIAQQPQFNEFQLRAALEFKLFCQKYSQLSDFEAQPYNEIINQIKQEIVKIMLTVDQKIFIQLLQAFQKISSKEFPFKWPNLIKELSQLSNNTQHMFRCLKSLKIIIQRYEYESRSDPLFEEIILVCDDFHDQLLTIVSQILNVLEQNQNVENQLLIAKILNQALKIFYFLNFFDIHPKFEDNLNTWMDLLVRSLRIQISDFIGFKIKGAALKLINLYRNILLYSRKYREDVEGLIQQFSQEIWQVCTSTNTDQKYDKIVINAMKYFRDLVSWNKMMPFFQSNIPNLMNSLILPNLCLNQNDNDLFLEEPDNFISIFFELSDITSRRYQSVQLLKMVFRLYNQQTVQFFENYLQNFVSQQQNNIQDHIQIINFLIDGGQLAFRPQEGVSKIAFNQEYIIIFYNSAAKNYFSQILGLTEKNQMNQINNIQLTFYLRFLYFYRNYITKEDLLSLVQIISGLVKINNPTIQQVFSIIKVIFLTIRAFLTLGTQLPQSFNDKVPDFFRNDQISLLAEPILNSIIYFLQQNTFETSSLLLVQTLVTKLGQLNNQFFNLIIQLYLNFLSQVKSHPFDLQFIIFDGIAFLLSNLNTNNLQIFEQKIIPIMVDMITSQGELVSLSLQILSLFLKIQTEQKPQLDQVYNFILQPSLWNIENQEHFQGYSLFLIQYFEKFPQNLQKDFQQITRIIEIFFVQQNYQILFFFMKNLFNNLPLQFIIQSNILSYLLKFSQQCYQQLVIYQQKINGDQLKKTEFIKNFITFICFTVQRKENQNFLQKVFYIIKCNEAQNGLVLGIMTSEIEFFKGLQGLERRIIMTGMVDMLFKEQGQFNGNVWMELLNSLIFNIQQNQKKGINFALQEQGNKIKLLSTFIQIQVNKFIKQINKVQNLNPDFYLAKTFQEFCLSNKETIVLDQIISKENQLILQNVIQKFSK